MIRMIASRRYYRTEDGREYEAGQAFDVADEREAARLVTRHKARLADKAMRAEAPAPLPVAELEAPALDPPMPRRRGRPPKSSYERRDMTARED